MSDQPSSRSPASPASPTPRGKPTTDPQVDEAGGPVSAAPLSRAPLSASPGAAASAPVLVIDDSEIAREEVSRVLRSAGFQVVALPSPIGATQAIVRHQARIVVVDIFMPTIRGDRLLTLFRKNQRLGHLNVILMSGHSEQELEKLQLEVQADAVISKRHLDRLPALIKRLAGKDR
ncbi:response regulator [Sorangium sp. So ce388]|uniref:response regulator n=1 Tax=Sorangium sp. So ce388 TaxID=3133309 RepID=UPI003F5BE64B